MMTTMSISTFGTYWFQNFGAIMLLGEVESVGQVWEMENQGEEWEKVCLGSFYVKPNYPGRSSHVSNGGFLVTEAARNKGVGRLMGEGYLEWAPKLVRAFLRSLNIITPLLRSPLDSIPHFIGLTGAFRVKIHGILAELLNATPCQSMGYYVQPDRMIPLLNEMKHSV